VKIYVLAAASMNMAVFWVVAPRNLVEVHLMIEAESTSETSVKFYQSVRRNNPEGSHLKTQNIFEILSRISFILIFLSIFK
jgi:hypothetical protein